jgi:hypothetical protein
MCILHIGCIFFDRRRRLPDSYNHENLEYFFEMVKSRSHCLSAVCPLVLSWFFLKVATEEVEKRRKKKLLIFFNIMLFTLTIIKLKRILN